MLAQGCVALSRDNFDDFMKQSQGPEGKVSSTIIDVGLLRRCDIIDGRKDTSSTYEVSANVDGIQSSYIQFSIDCHTFPSLSYHVLAPFFPNPYLMHLPRRDVDSVSDAEGLFLDLARVHGKVIFRVRDRKTPSTDEVCRYTTVRVWWIVCIACG